MNLSNSGNLIIYKILNDFDYNSLFQQIISAENNIDFKNLKNNEINPNLNEYGFVKETLEIHNNKIFTGLYLISPKINPKMISKYAIDYSNYSEKETINSELSTVEISSEIFDKYLLWIIIISNKYIIISAQDGSYIKLNESNALVENIFSIDRKNEFKQDNFSEIRIREDISLKRIVGYCIDKNIAVPYEIRIPFEDIEVELSQNNFQDIFKTTGGEILDRDLKLKNTEWKKIKIRGDLFILGFSKGKKFSHNVIFAEKNIEERLNCIEEIIRILEYGPRYHLASKKIIKKPELPDFF